MVSDEDMFPMFLGYTFTAKSLTIGTNNRGRLCHGIRYCVRPLFKYLINDQKYPNDVVILVGLQAAMERMNGV